MSAISRCSSSDLLLLNGAADGYILYVVCVNCVACMCIHQAAKQPQ